MAAVSLKEALARGQCLCTCDFLRKGGCIWEVLGFPLYRECREGRQTDSLNRIQGKFKYTNNLNQAIITDNNRMIC